MSSRTLANYLEVNLAKLQALACNWDGEGEEPPTPQAISTLQQTLLAVADSQTVFPYLSPADERGLAAEWNVDSWRLELMVDASGQEVTFTSLIHGDYELPSAEQFRRLLRDLSAQVEDKNSQWRDLFPL